MNNRLQSYENIILAEIPHFLDKGVNLLDVKCLL